MHQENSGNPAQNPNRKVFLVSLCQTSVVRHHSIFCVCKQASTIGFFDFGAIYLPIIDARNKVAAQCHVPNGPPSNTFEARAVSGLINAGSGRARVSHRLGMGRAWVSFGSGLGRPWVGLGSGLGQAESGLINAGSGRARVRLGSCSCQPRVGLGSSSGGSQAFILWVWAFCGPRCLFSKIGLGQIK
jgi:hypothetical protein